MPQQHKATQLITFSLDVCVELIWFFSVKFHIFDPDFSVWSSQYSAVVSMSVGISL